MEAVLAVVVAVAGWIATGVLARRAARRTMRVEYLLSAYRRLDDASNRWPMTPEHEKQMEAAIADIQLLGSAKQVRLADKVTREFTETRNSELSPLLEDLRKSLRKELLLGKVEPRRFWLRIESGEYHSSTYDRPPWEYSTDPRYNDIRRGLADGTLLRGNTGPPED